MSTHRKRLLVVVNDLDFFVSHRLPLAVRAAECGFDVHVATPPGRAVDQIRTTGITYHTFPLSRRGLNPIREIGTLLRLTALIRRLKPHMVHLVTMKPVIYGGVVSRFLGVPRTIAAISGLGSVFIDESRRGKVLRFLSTRLYRAALHRPGVRAIFQNESDRQHFVDSRVVRREQTTLIRGSGVDLALFKPLPLAAAPGVVMMASRLLRDKGLIEFVNAAEQVRQARPNARFVLVGDTDEGNPTSVSPECVRAWVDAGILEWWGYRDDMHEVLRHAQIVVLPSYREGLPKILAEAAACGIATVTTDVPGCRDAVIPDVTGLLVPVKDAARLALAIVELLDDPDRCARMGAAGRELAEREFSIDVITSQHIDLYSQDRG